MQVLVNGQHAAGNVELRRNAFRGFTNGEGNIAAGKPMAKSILTNLKSVSALSTA